jgi:hypothetical protein
MGVRIKLKLRSDKLLLEKKNKRINQQFIPVIYLITKRNKRGSEIAKTHTKYNAILVKFKKNSKIG